MMGVSWAWVLRLTVHAAPVAAQWLQLVGQRTSPWLRSLRLLELHVRGGGLAEGAGEHGAEEVEYANKCEAVDSPVVTSLEKGEIVRIYLH